MESNMVFETIAITSCSIAKLKLDRYEDIS